MNLEEYQEAKRLYQEGMSLTELGKMFKTSRHKLSHMFKKEGITVRTRKYEINETYFDKIDSEEKAYWLGFLYADGYVTNEGRYNVALTLKAEDKSHIEKLQQIICPKQPLHIKRSTLDEKEYESYTLNLSSKHMVESLIEKGCTPKKSLTLTFPTFLPKNLERHFMRGYFDGDGGLYVQPERKWFRAYLLGTEDFLNSFQTIISNETGLSITKLYHDKRHSDNTFTLTKGGFNTVRTFMDFLYKDATIYLDRKYHEYCKLKNCRP